MDKEKKKFKETKFGKFLDKAAQSIPEILTVGGKLATGNIGGAIEETKSILTKKATTDAKAKELLLELEKEQMNYAMEMYKIEAGDRDSARKREAELAQAGKSDWMMVITGLVGLGAFILMIIAVIWIPAMEENKLFVHLMGIIEGVVITNIFAYYYGTSKSSKDKTSMLKPK